MAAAALLGLIGLVIALAVAAEMLGDHLGVPNHHTNNEATSGRRIQ